MNTLIVLALLAIALNIYWNCKRARAGFGRLAECRGRYDANEAIMSELGHEREKLALLKARYAELSTSHPGTVSAWSVVDFQVKRMRDCLMKLNFAGALAAIKDAVLEAETLVAENA
ncbi:MAG: hypothetical protein K8F91_01090 [Candidatus Obscuribacterales bacterium]|nr:hypothetical protein [Candidatus Obscuribacterales bacterium]